MVTPKIISIEDNSVVFGMSWGMIRDPKKQKSEAKSFAKRHAANHFVTVAGESALKVGSCNAEKKKGTKKFFSAAALFSLTFDDAEYSHVILVLELEKDYALIALDHGLPYADEIVSETEIDGRIESILNETGGREDYVFFGGWPTSTVDVREFNQFDLVNLDDTKGAELTAFSERKGVGLLVCGVVIAAGLYGYDFWEQEQKRIQLEESQKVKVDPVKLYTESVEKQLSTAFLSPQEISAGIWKTIQSTELNTAGWSLLGIDCNRSACKERWKNKNGTAQELLAAIPLGEKNFAQDGLSVEISKPLQLKFSSINQKSLPLELDYQLWSRKFDDLCRSVKVKCVFRIKKNEVFGVPKEIQASDVPAEIAILKGDVTIEGPLGLMNEFTSLQSNVSISNIGMSFEGGVAASKFKIVGDYFVKRK